MFNIQFCFGVMHFKQKTINFDFFLENSYFPCSQFHNERMSYSKSFSGIKFFICEPIFKIFAA